MWVILIVFANNSSFNSCLPSTGQVSGLGKHIDIGVSCTHICCDHVKKAPESGTLVEIPIKTTGLGNLYSDLGTRSLV